VDALTYLRGGGASITLNAGYGHGYSVRQVLESVERVSGRLWRYARSRAEPGTPERWWRAPIASGPSSCGAHGLTISTPIVRSALAWEERLLRDPW